MHILCIVCRRSTPNLSLPYVIVLLLLFLGFIVATTCWNVIVLPYVNAHTACWERGEGVKKKYNCIYTVKVLLTRIVFKFECEFRSDRDTTPTPNRKCQCRGIIFYLFHFCAIQRRRDTTRDTADICRWDAGGWMVMGKHVDVMFTAVQMNCK